MAVTAASFINLSTDMAALEASERHCDMVLDALCSSAVDDLLLKSLERDFGAEAVALHERLEADLELDFEKFRDRMADRCDLALDALCEKAMDDNDATALQALEDEFGGPGSILDFDTGFGDDMIAFDLPVLVADCDRALDGIICDLSAVDDDDDRHAAVLKGLEIEFEGPSGALDDDEPPAKAFCVRELEESLSRRVEEKLSAEASAAQSAADGALEVAFEEYLEQLVADEPATPVRLQERCVNLLEAAIDRVRGAYASYLWWVI